MIILKSDEIARAIEIMHHGGVIAYPTEAVFGLGCDIFNEKAILKLCEIKKRELAKGFIILISNYEQLDKLINKSKINDNIWQQIKKSWPGHITWVFPKSNLIQKNISGDHATIAIRMSAHPIARALCTEFPIVSTSANITKYEPARDLNNILCQFPEGLDAVIDGPLGREKNPSTIIDAITGNKYR